MKKTRTRLENFPSIAPDDDDLSPSSAAEVNRKPAAQRTRHVNNKSNITAKRVTLPPGFLSQCVSSKTVHKSGHSRDAISSADNTADLIVESPECKLRRSARINSNNTNNNNSGNIYQQNRSKSIFREIKAKYAAQTLSEVDVNHDFGAKIFEKLPPNFALNDSSYYKAKIFHEIIALNQILTGLNRDRMSLNHKRQYQDEDDKENNYPRKFSHIPPSRWVLQTPPNRKLTFNNANCSNVSDNMMKPAVVQNLGEKKVVYEMNNKINFNLDRYASGSQINIDKRYMVEVANFDDEGSNVHFMDLESPQKKINLQEPDSCALETYFSSLTCRPKKTVTARSRVASLKRKRDIFEPGSSNSIASNLDEIAELSNNEESFTFQFTPSDEQDATTVSHFYDLDGNKKNMFHFN